MIVLMVGFSDLLKYFNFFFLFQHKEQALLFGAWRLLPQTQKETSFLAISTVHPMIISNTEMQPAVSTQQGLISLPFIFLQTKRLAFHVWTSFHLLEARSMKPAQKHQCRVKSVKGIRKYVGPGQMFWYF